MKRILTAIMIIMGVMLNLAYADIPKTINFQGRLTDQNGNVVIDGYPSITFRIWTHPTSNDEEAHKAWTGVYTVQVKEGYFNVELGSGGYDFESPKKLEFDTPYYLDMQLGSDVFMTPRFKLNSSAYAMNVRDGAISTVKIKDGAVTTEKIDNGAVTVDKLAANAVINNKIADGAVTTGKISNNSVNSDKIANNAVNTAKITDGAVTTAKIANNAVSQSYYFVYKNPNDQDKNTYTHTNNNQLTVINQNIVIDKPGVMIIHAKGLMHSDSATQAYAQWELHINDGWGDVSYLTAKKADDVGTVYLMVRREMNPGTINLKLIVYPKHYGTNFRTHNHRMLVDIQYK